MLDLACGTGTITARLLARFPEATSTGVDLDPALLTIAEGTFAGDERVTFVTADLKDPGWTEGCRTTRTTPSSPPPPCTGCTANLSRHLYGQIAELVRDGGVFMNADHMIDDTTPRINAAERALRHARMDRAKADGALDWAEWWQLAAKDPVLAGPTARRFEIYGEHADGDMPSAAWHARVLREKGFAEARPVWCSPSDTLLLARQVAGGQRTSAKEGGTVRGSVPPLTRCAVTDVRAPWTGTTWSARAAGWSGRRAGCRTRPPRRRP